MKKIFFLITGLVINLSAVFAQDTNEVAENNNTRSQQQIMDEYNSRSNVELKFYPNPAVNYLVVEPQLSSEAGEIKIMDITGKVQSALHLEPGSNGVTVDLSNYMSGLYVLTLYDSSNHLLHISRFNKE